MTGVSIDPVCTMPMDEHTMEVALANDIPTYAGGLGVLAGDTLRSLADLEVPAVALSLVHRKGYFRQVLQNGRVAELDATWRPEDRLIRLAPVVTVGIEVVLKGLGPDGAFSATSLSSRSADDRHLTHHLYGGDERYRLMQEAVLGVGGVRMLDDAAEHRPQRFLLQQAPHGQAVYAHAYAL
jgi:glycogen phosphorylase